MKRHMRYLINKIRTGYMHVFQMIAYIILLGTLGSGIFIICSFVKDSNANTIAVMHLPEWKEEIDVKLARIEGKIDGIHKKLTRDDD